MLTSTILNIIIIKDFFIIAKFQQVLYLNYLIYIS